MVVGLGDAEEFINGGTFINDGNFLFDSGVIEGTEKEQCYDYLYCTGDIRILSNDLNGTGICPVTF